jgi:putative two-component system response regulator
MPLSASVSLSAAVVPGSAAVVPGSAAAVSGRAVHVGARLLVIDDEQPNLDLMGRVLGRVGYEQVTLTTDPGWALDNLGELAPDLILVDLHMPSIDGLQVLRQLKTLVDPDDLLPRLVITADTTAATRRAAIGEGAHDFLTKPIDVAETTLRVANLLQTRMLHVRLREHNERLEDTVRVRTGQLELSHHELARRLALVGEYRDDETAQHTVRVGVAAERLATAVGFTPAEAALLGEAAPLHDIGKIAIPDEILRKPGPLTPEEFEVIKTHPEVGAHILGGGRSQLLRLAEQVALTHHERWDGTGYPHGLRGQGIPLAGRVVAVVDVFDALTSARPYKTAWTVPEAAEEMHRQRGRHFDPDVLDVFLDQLPT